MIDPTDGGGPLTLDQIVEMCDAADRGAMGPLLPWAGCEEDAGTVQRESRLGAVECGGETAEGGRRGAQGS